MTVKARIEESDGKINVRLAVVTRLEPDFVELVYGQSKGDPSRDVLVSLGSREGRSMGIDRDTYFAARNAVFVSRARVVSRAGHCPATPWVGIQRLAEEQRRLGFPNQPKSAAAAHRGVPHP